MVGIILVSAVCYSLWIVSSVSLQEIPLWVRLLTLAVAVICEIGSVIAEGKYESRIKDLEIKIKELERNQKHENQL